MTRLFPSSLLASSLLASALLASALLLAACGPSDREAAAACVKARESLEAVRANIGGFCGTPDITAHTDILALGAAAAPCLRVALADRDYEVAFAAAVALRDGGRESVLKGWCVEQPSHPNRGVCTFTPAPARSAIPSFNH